MMEELTSNFYTIAGACLLASFGAYLAYRNFRKNRLAKAAVNFRSTIDTSVFSGLSGHSLHSALIKYFPEHRKAANEYQLYLNLISKLRFYFLWRAYHGGNEEQPNFTRYYIPDGGYELLISKLDALKKFANQA